jgi:hypothetical protein
MKPAFIDIDGRRFAWKDLVRRRQEQLQAARRQTQLALFELREDSRPVYERTALGRYSEPGLFSLMSREG